jgi:hypothetical protein
MLDFVDHDRRREMRGELGPELFIIECLDDTVPKFQPYRLIRATLVKASKTEFTHRTTHMLRWPMPELACFLAKVDDISIKNRQWRFNSHELRLTLKTPVSIGEYDNIETIHMTYNTQWARTPVMLAGPP